jgi:3-phenylpropionate/trans-cinnamate dioxygenase ferredoxin subunit
MNQFVAVANATEVSDPGSKLVELDGQMLVLIHAAGRFYALDDLCTHDAGPLSGGIVRVSGTIACPRHGARFDLETGAAMSMPATKATRVHEVKVDGEDVLVKLSNA